MLLKEMRNTATQN